MEPLQVFRSAALCFRELVERIPEDRWEQPGLGVWDIRGLTGHTSRALATVVSYLARPAEREVIHSPAQYYAELKRAGGSTDPAAVVERGRQAGQQLGPDPAAAVQALVDDAFMAIANCGDPLIETIAGGMRLTDYLPTRTFELAVHSLDIGAAAGLDVTLPPAVLLETTTLAAEIAVELGDGVHVLRALTGRGLLRNGFSIV